LHTRMDHLVQVLNEVANYTPTMQIITPVFIYRAESNSTDADCICKLLQCDSQQAIRYDQALCHAHHTCAVQVRSCSTSLRCHQITLQATRTTLHYCIPCRNISMIQACMLSGIADQCILGNVYLRSKISRKLPE